MRPMKDSGLDWVGEIPANWGVENIQGCFTCERRGNAALSRTKAMKFLDGKIVPKPECETDDYQERILSTYQFVDKNAIVINGLNLNYDLKSKRTGIAEEKGVITSAYLVINPMAHRINPSYANYLFKGYDYCKAFHNMGTGIRKTLAWSEYKHVQLPIPEYEEQQSIVDYLDARCAEIDEVKQTLESEIESLQRLRKSIIHKAVTKGLSEAVPMRYSGIEWVGVIPAHWTLPKLKRVCSKITDGSHFSPTTVDEGYPYVTATNINGRGIDYTLAKLIDEQSFNELARNGCRPKRNDILMVKDGATTGRVGIMTDDEPCVILSSVALIRCNGRCLPSYLYWFIQSPFFQEQVRISMAGAAMPRTTLDKLVGYIVFIPPIQEQRQIADYLDERCAAIDSIIETRTKQLERLEDYRKALIFAYATGKKEVPANE